MDFDYDVIVLGGGPGGYLAAERLGHAGKKVLLVEAAALGGTCLNVGCIPTKTLLHSAKEYLHALEGSQFGISCDNLSFDWARMQQWKTDVVKGLVSGIGAAQRKAGVTVVNGHGTFEGPCRVSVGGSSYSAEHIILATGSAPVMPAIPGADGNPALVDSTGLLSIGEVPSRLAIIGGGVIGLEFAALFATLGSDVTVIEMLDEVAPFADTDLAAALRRAMPKVNFKLGCRVESLDGGDVTYSRNGQSERLAADVVLMAVGRAPAVTGWGADGTGLDLSAKGIVVDERMRTNLPNVWAVGDVTGRSLLAHAAYRMAEVAVANILDEKAHLAGDVMRWHTIPWCVYTLPEMAGIGYTERQAKADGRAVLVGKVPAKLSGRFIAENGFRAPGHAKVIVDAKTRRVLGIQVLGTYASEMIWGASAVLETELDLTELRQLVFPHPSVSEIIREAAWAVRSRKH